MHFPELENGQLNYNSAEIRAYPCAVTIDLTL